MTAMPTVSERNELVVEWVASEGLGDLDGNPPRSGGRVRSLKTAHPILGPPMIRRSGLGGLRAPERASSPRRRVSRNGVGRSTPETCRRAGQRSTGSNSSALRWSSSVGLVYVRTVSKRAWPRIWATVTRSVPPRTRMVAQVCRRTWAVAGSSRAAAAAAPAGGRGRTRPGCWHSGRCGAMPLQAAPPARPGPPAPCRW